MKVVLVSLCFRWQWIQALLCSHVAAVEKRSDPTPWLSTAWTVVTLMGKWHMGRNQSVIYEMWLRGGIT